MHWTALILLSTFIAAGASVLDKRLMDGRAVHPFAAAASFGIVGLPVSTVGLMLLPPTPWPEALLGLSAGGLFILAAWLYYDAVACEEISRLVPLFRLTALQTLLLEALFLGETLTERQLAAFGVMLAGGLLLVLKPRAGGFTFSRVALRVLPVTTLLALNGVLTAHIYRTTSLWAGVVWENLGMALSAGLLGLVWVGQRLLDRRTRFVRDRRPPLLSMAALGRRRSAVVPAVSHRPSAVVRRSAVSGPRSAWRSAAWGKLSRTIADREHSAPPPPPAVWGVLILEQTLRLATGLAPAWAIAHGVPVGLVAALGGIRPAWVWLLAVWWLHEPLDRREFLLKGGGMVGMGLGLRLLI